MKEDILHICELTVKSIVKILLDKAIEYIKKNYGRRILL